MALERMIVNKETNTVYVWDTEKKRWLLTPDVTIPVLESLPPKNGYATTNIYVDADTKKVVLEYENKL